MAKTNAQKQRAMRQEELRELISKKGLVQQVLVDIGKLDDLAGLKYQDFENKDEYLAQMGTAKDKAGIIKTAIDSRMRLVNKYLPDLKQQEITGTGENGEIEVDQFIQIEFINLEDSNSGQV